MTPTTRATPALLAAALRAWTPRTGVRTAGTVVVLAGRGETAEVYERFGRRLSAEGCRVVAVAERAPHPAAVADLLADLPRPHVLVGADAGALAAVRCARDTPVDGVVLAGLPTSAGEHRMTWHDELDARTGCAEHRRVLELAARTSLFADATALRTGDLAHAGSAPLAVPALAVHGTADRISPHPHAVEAYRALGAEVLLVPGGRHDVLNDVGHGAVASAVVDFVGRLRRRSADPAARAVSGARAVAGPVPVPSRADRAAVPVPA